MCRELRALQESIVEYAGRFDAASLTPGQAGEVVRLCARIEASAGSIKALAAARSAEGQGWRQEGHRSAADQLAHDAGMSPAAAKRALQTGQRMAGQPDVASAALAGELSVEQAAAVSDGVAANPEVAGELLDTARRSSLPELNEEVARIKAARCDPEARWRAVHAKRSLRRWTDRDGAFHAHLYGHPEDGAGLWRMLDPIRRRLNILRRETGGPVETLDALDYDALMSMAAIAGGKYGELGLADLVGLGLFPQLDELDELGDSAPSGRAAQQAELTLTDYPDRRSADDPAGPAGRDTGPAPPSLAGRRTKKLAGSPMRVMIRVDLDALLRGVALEGELCEIAGYGPVPVSVIEDLLAPRAHSSSAC
jgi:hypothetical protein